MQAQEEVSTMIRRKRSGSKRPRLALTMATASSSGTTSDVFSGTSDRLSPSSSNSAVDEEEEEEDMANCLILLARGSSHPPADAYSCKTCNKSFPSFQALGGHRASHKRPQNNKTAMATATTLNVNDDEKHNFQSDGPDDSAININSSHHTTNKSRVHECSICGAEFASGQALGGHMRRHRPIPPPPPRGETQDTKRQRNVLSLDLNLPAPAEDDRAEPNKFPFAAKEQVMIFSASPLIDCHY